METPINTTIYDAIPDINFSKSDTECIYLRFTQQCLKELNLHSVEWENNDRWIAPDVEVEQLPERTK
jgi:hypothetical protein